ncbi:MAG: hypothetical protein ACK5NF_07245 [Bacilli bacterium]
MLEDKLYYNKLFDCYEKMFTKTQKEYFTAYFHNDFSLSEISENMSVSRAAISKQLRVIKDSLDLYESNLKLSKLYDTIDYVRFNIDELSKKDIYKIMNRMSEDE